MSFLFSIISLIKHELFTENALCSEFSWNRRSVSGEEDLYVVIAVSPARFSGGDI